MCYESPMTSRPQEVYKGLPLSDISPQKRGTIIEGVVQRFLEDKYGTTATFLRRKRSDGRKRGNAATYDLPSVENGTRSNRHSSGGIRVEPWYAQWKAIKSDLHDVPILVLYTPSGLYLFEHDGTFAYRLWKAQESSGGSSVVHATKRIYMSRRERFFMLIK